MCHSGLNQRCLHPSWSTQIVFQVSLKYVTQVSIWTDSFQTVLYRELQEPLIPWEVVTSLFSAIQQPNAQTKLDRMSESLSIMPLAHHGTLVILIQHLKKVMDYDPKTDINNMAITFGPNLMWAPLKLQSANTTVTIQKQQMVIKGLLENANDLFELSDRSRRSSRVSV